MIQEMYPSNMDNRTIYAFDRLQKFICVHHKPIPDRIPRGVTRSVSTDEARTFDLVS